MAHFEVHRLVDERWLLDAVFDDQAQAIEDARSLMARARSLAAVRVLKVEEQQSGFVEWIVYNRDSANERVRSQRLAPSLMPLRRRVPAFGGQVGGFARRPARRASFSSPALALTVLFALGGLLVLLAQRLEPRGVWVFDRPEAQAPHALRNPWTGEVSR